VLYVNAMEIERPTIRRCIPICVLAVWLSSLPASADILIESYRDTRPADADSILGPLRDELAKAEVKIRPVDIIAAAGEQLPLSGVSDPAFGSSYPVDPAGQVELGTKQVFRGDYEAGLATLEAVLKSAHQNPALVVADTSSATWLTKAYASVAFAHLRINHLDAATESVAEQIRSFPDNPIGRMVGPDVANLAETTRKAVDASPHGTLRILVSQPDVQIFLDERAQGRGTALLTLTSGTHRLLLVRLETSRRYSVAVVPDRVTHLAIDWDADATFTAMPHWIGFRWPRGEDDKTEATATRYAQGGRQHDIYVVSILRRNGRRFIDGQIFEKHTGAPVRHKAIEIGREDDPCSRALAQYLLKGDLSSCLVDLPSDAIEVPGGIHTTRDPYLLPGIVAGIGAMSVIGGTALLASKQDPATPSGGPSYLSWPGVGLIAAGGVAIGTAAYLTKRASSNAEAGHANLRHSHAPLYAAAGTTAAAFAVGGYLLHLDGKGTCGRNEPGSCYYRYNSAPYGWTLIGAGIAAAGFGVYWQLSAPGDSQAPTVSLTPTATGALACIVGSF
jgi:hypothetical protein